jgi:hypothetical protein
LESTALQPGRGWVIGHGAKCQVRVGFDPYASREDAEIVLGDGKYHLRGLRTRRNATSVNRQPLAHGEECILRRGDVLRVGCSLLLFLDE